MTMTKKSCLTCTHWRAATRPGLRLEAVGECRMWPPPRDFGWPRTTADDGCGQHTTFTTGTPGAAQAAPGERSGGPAGAVAPEAPRSTAPQTGGRKEDARPARAPKGEGKPEGAGRSAPL